MKKILPISFLILAAITGLFGLGCVASVIGSIANWWKFSWELLYVTLGLFGVTCIVNMLWTLRRERK